MTLDQLKQVAVVLYEVQRLLELSYVEMRAGGAGTDIDEICRLALARSWAADDINAQDLQVAFKHAYEVDLRNRKKAESQNEPKGG